MMAANAPGRPALYFTVARTALADRLSYRGDVILAALMGAARVFLAMVLWTAVFDGRETVGGMDLGLMAGYYLVAVFLFQVDQSAALANELAVEIRMGLLGKYLARPVDLLSWFLSVSAGRSAFQACATLGAAFLAGLAVGPLCGIPLAPFTLRGTIEALPIALLGLLCLGLVNFMTAILAFRFQDIGAFNIAKNCVVEFLSGALVPLALLPAWARSALSWTPFPSLASLPADLMLGRAGPGAVTGADGPEGVHYVRSLAILAIWVLLLYGAARLLYSSLSDRYEELGS